MMNRNKIHEVVDWIAVGILCAELLLCWVFKAGQDMIMPWSTIISFFILGLFFLNHIDLRECLRGCDFELYLILVGCIWAFINLRMINSNMGAIVTIVDFLLILYLADKVKLQRSCIQCVMIICFILSFYWFILKRPVYGNVDFNTNGSACIVFCVSLLAYFSYVVLRKSDKKNIFMLLVLVLIAILSIRLKARGVLLGLIFIAFSYYVMPKKKWVIYFVSIGSLIFPFIYIWMWKMGIDFIIPFIGKKFISGRELIWPQFLEAFLQHPITGIGSDFKRMVPTSAFFEVHHALLNILFVHGIPVFMITFYLLTKRMMGLYNTKNMSKTVKMGTALLYGMFVIGTFENFYITSPYNMIFFMIMVISYQYMDETWESK